MRKNLWAVAALLVALALILAACSGTSGTGSKSSSALTVEKYLQAVVSKDAAKVSNLACKAWESQALLEMDAFQAVKAELEGVSCKDAGTDGSATLVACTGNIVLTYDNEKRSLDVSRQTYKTVQEGGDWRVCGYK
jgi:predicted small secreted protein